MRIAVQFSRQSTLRQDQTAEIYEEEIFVFYVDDPEAFVEALRDYMVNAGAGEIWGQ